MSNIIDILDKSHILDKIKKIPLSLFIEIIIFILLINIIFSYIYYKIYKNDKNSFKNIYNNKEISLFDFYFFSNTTYFSLGYDLIPQSKMAKMVTIIQLKLSFIIMTVCIAKIIN